MNVTFRTEFHKKEQDLNENINKLQGSSSQHFLTQKPPNCMRTTRDNLAECSCKSLH